MPGTSHDLLVGPTSTTTTDLLRPGPVQHAHCPRRARPTLAGQTSSKVYVTNLFDAVLPLKRDAELILFSPQAEHTAVMDHILTKLATA
jgi:hypothetical protein